MTFYNIKPAEIGCRGGNGNHEPLALGNFGRLVSGSKIREKSLKPDSALNFCTMMRFLS